MLTSLRMIVFLSDVRVVRTQIPVADDDAFQTTSQSRLIRINDVRVLLLRLVRYFSPTVPQLDISVPSYIIFQQAIYLRVCAVITRCVHKEVHFSDPCKRS